MWKAEFKFHLYPVEAHYQATTCSLKELLSTLGLMGKPIIDRAIDGTIIRYEVGDKFLSLLTFMGCSPNIELEPQHDKPYCYIELEQAKAPQFIAGKNIKPTKCPHCKSLIHQPSCENCHKEIEPEKLNWRKTAFYASCWITIANIYALEAIPSDSLLNVLEKETGMKWKAAYVRYDV